MICYQKYERMLANGQIARLPNDPGISDVYNMATPFTLIPKTKGELWFVGESCVSIIPKHRVFNFKKPIANHINITTQRNRIAEVHFIVYPWSEENVHDGCEYPSYSKEYPSLRDIEYSVKQHIHALFIHPNGCMRMTTFDYTLCKGQKILLLRRSKNE